MAEMQVDIVWDGKRWQFPNHPVEIIESVDVLASPPRYSPRRFRAQVDMGDVAAYLADGHAVSSIQCMISRDGVVVSSSPVKTITAARDGELATLSIAEEPDADRSMIPSRHNMRMRFVAQAATDRANAKIDARNAAKLEGMYGEPFEFDGIGWSREGGGNFEPVEVNLETHTAIFDDRIQGRVYPLVIGNPGRGAVLNSKGVRAARAYPIDSTGAAEKILVAGHTVTGGNVIIYQDGTGQEVFATETTTNLKGRSITQVDVSAAAVITYSEGDTYYAAWNSTAEGLPGNGADVLLYLVSQTRGVRLDLSRLETVSERLAGYVLDRFMDEQVSAWRVLLDEVLRLMPVALIPTPEGVGPVWLNFAPVAADVRMTVAEGADFSALTQDAEYGDTRSVVNAWSLKYAFTVNKGAYREVASADGTNYGAAAQSENTHGLRQGERQTAWVYDDATAQRIVGDWLQRTAFVRPSFEYLANPAVYGVEGTSPLEGGMIVEVTDASHSLTAAKAMVSKTRRFGDDLRITLTILDEWR